MSYTLNLLKRRILSAVSFILLLTTIGYAQCPIANFTLTPIAGVCIQDGQVQVSIPGASGCVGVTAGIRPSGASADIDVINITSTGTGTFFNLPVPGTYEVYFYQGSTVIGPKTVTVTTSYTPMSISLAYTQPSCKPTDPLYTGNATLTATVTGGAGPFTYTLNTGQTYGPTTDTSHTFTGLGAGTYNITVTDNSPCSDSKTINISIPPNTTPNLQLTNILLPRDSCTTFDFLYRGTDGNQAVLRQPGNATITYGSSTYNSVITSTVATQTRYSTVPMPSSTSYTISLTDGCRIVTSTGTTPAIDDDYLIITPNRAAAGSGSDPCAGGGGGASPASIDIRGWTTNPTAWHFLSQNKVEIFREQPCGSGTFVLVTTIFNVTALNSSTTPRNVIVSSDPVNNTCYRIIASDSCHTVTRDVIILPDLPAGSGPKDPIYTSSRIIPAESVLEGTVGFQWAYSGRSDGSWYLNVDDIAWPVTLTITRLDGITSMTINPTHPYGLAGTYSMTFPMAVVFNRPPAPVPYHFHHVGDLPPGQYAVNIANANGCDTTINVNLTNAVTYSPTVTVVPGCLNSVINYSMGHTNTPNRTANVKLRQNTTTGPVFATNGPWQGLSGTFYNVPSGTYWIEYEQVNFKAVNNTNSLLSCQSATRANTVFSAATGDCAGGINRSYFVQVTVTPYQPLSFTTAQINCPTGGATLAITSTGIPVDSIKFSIWPSTANPDVDTAFRSFTSTTLPYSSHVFTGLPIGTYIVRVRDNCGYTQQTVVISPTSPVIPKVTSPDTIVCLSLNNAVLSINLPEVLYNIEWLDSATGTSLGTSSSLTVTPSQTTTYTVKYVLKPAFNCAGDTLKSLHITVTMLGSTVPVLFDSLCIGNTGDSIRIYAPGPANANYLWTPPTSLSNPTIQNPYITSPGATTYTVTLQVGSGCVDTLQINVNAMAKPDAAFSMETDPSCDGVLSSFTNESTGANSYLWNFGDGTQSNEENPSHLFNYLEIYNTSLMVYSANGCADTTSLAINSGSFEERFFPVKIPNVFTPNNDGQNELFKPDLPDIITPCTHVQIFNRWGLEVFNSTGKNTIVWDGKMPSGEQAPDGTYFFIIDVKGTIEKGSLTLLR